MKLWPRRGLFRTGAMLACCLAVAPVAAIAAAIPQPLIDDTYTVVSKPTRNFGGADKIVITAAKTAYFHFDLSQLGSTVNSATLTLPITSVLRAGETTLHRVIGPWTESTLSHANAPAFDPLPIGHAVVAAAQTSLVIDLASLVRTWAQGAVPNYGLAVTTLEARLLVATKEAGNGAVLAVDGGPGPSPIPIAHDDDLLVSVGTPRTGSVLADNGHGVDQLGTPPNSVVLTQNVVSGQLDLAADGGFVYTPGSGFVGTDAFEYQIMDGSGVVSNVARVSLLVRDQTVSGAPNIVYFVADDVGWGDPLPYNPNSLIAMPTLERMAAEGMRFTDAHTAASKCAPSRYSLVTGNYHWRGLREYGQWKYTGGSQILPGQQTLGDILRNAGYATAAIGKQHLGGNFYIKNSERFAPASLRRDRVDFGRSYRDGPLERGFDYSFTVLSGIQALPYAFFENDRLVGDPDSLIEWTTGNHNGSRIITDGIGVPDWDSRTVGPRLGQAAVDFIARHDQRNVEQGTEQPFFLYYASQSAHSPFTPPKFFADAPVAGVTGLGASADMVHEVDVALGMLVGELEQRGLLTKTIIVFTSDNGGFQRARFSGHDSLPGLRGEKGDSYEGGHRVPLVVRWGDGTPTGSPIALDSVRDELIAVQDLVATLAAAGGALVPPEQAVDSISFLPLLLSTPGAAGVRTEMVHHARTHNEVQVPHYFALRRGDWKLIFNEAQQPQELFNLRVDPGERRNLRKQALHADRVDAMRSALVAILASDRTAP